jgi:hypothetical protein
MYQAWRAGCEYIVMLDDDCDPKTVKPTSSVPVAFRSTIAPSLPVKERSCHSLGSSSLR